MTKNRLLGAMLGLACAPGVRAGDREETQIILDKFHSVRPQPAELAIYQLDWAPTLEAAKERAAKEARPIFLVFITNSFGDLRSGHC